MKKTVIAVLAMLMVLILAACAAAPAEPAVQEPTVVVFNDSILEAKVREAMGIPEGDITIDAAETVTSLELGIDWQQNPVAGTQIEDISALKYFTNLESLGIQFHAVKDVSPLAGLTKLKSLGLGGNPVQDVSPLAGLTELDFLTLFNSQAADYSALANMTKLRILYAGYSTVNDASVFSGLTNLDTLTLNSTLISDVSPLASLTNLRVLQLADNNIADFTPLKGIYPQLEEKDFMLVSSLDALGFVEVDDFYGYKSETDAVSISHENAGNDEDYPIIVSPDQYAEKRVVIGYNPDTKKYDVTVLDQEKAVARYTYNETDITTDFSLGDMKETEGIIKDMMLYPEGNVAYLEAPIQLFKDRLIALFGMTADELYTLPLRVEEAPASTPSPDSLVFTESKDIAAYLYVDNGEHYYDVAIHNPEWGTWDVDADISFFTPLSDYYRIVVAYNIEEARYYVGVDDNDGGGAKFHFDAKTGEHVDEWCSDNNLTVEAYFKKAFNDPSITDVYAYSVTMMTDYIETKFGMSMEELYNQYMGE